MQSLIYSSFKRGENKSYFGYPYEALFCTNEINKLMMVLTEWLYRYWVPYEYTHETQVFVYVLNTILFMINLVQCSLPFCSILFPLHLHYQDKPSSFERIMELLW